MTPEANSETLGLQFIDSVYKYEHQSKQMIDGADVSQLHFSSAYRLS